VKRLIEIYNYFSNIFGKIQSNTFLLLMSIHRCYLHKDVTYTKMLPTQLCYLHNDVTYTKMLPTQWCYLHNDVTYTKMLPTQWCYLHKDVTYTKMLPTQWCYLNNDVTYTKMLPTQRCYLHKDVTYTMMLPTQWCYPKSNMMYSLNHLTVTSSKFCKIHLKMPIYSVKGGQRAKGGLNLFRFVLRRDARNKFVIHHPMYCTLDCRMWCLVRGLCIVRFWLLTDWTFWQWPSPALHPFTFVLTSPRPSGYVTCHQVEHSKCLHSTQRDTRFYS
jgi:hypothetical protein